jgi:hypothetical protein
MQGLFVNEEHTPPECLRRDLEARMSTRVSLLNAGILGYSPEQYYYSLVAFADRFRPQFVVVSFFANDFGDESEVTKGHGDWDEGAYWLGEILKFAQARDWTILFVPVPVVDRTFGRRKSGFYPGEISNRLNISAALFLNPAETFVNAHLSLLIEGEEGGEHPSGCLLFNEKIHDGHFSALGSQVWAESVGRRLALLIENKKQMMK